MAAILLASQAFPIWEGLEATGIAPVSDLHYTWFGFLGHSVMTALLTGFIVKYHWRRNPSWGWCKEHLAWRWLHYYALLDVAQIVLSLGDYWKYKHLYMELACATASALIVLFWVRPRLKAKHDFAEENKRRNAGR